MADLKKVFVLFIILFCIFEILFGLTLLDIFNLMDYAKFNFNLEINMSFGISLIFFLGIALGLILLLKADEDFDYLKTTKIIFSLFFIFSPIFLIILWSFLNLFHTNFEGISLFSPILPIILIFTLTLIGLIIPLYFFDTAWNSSKKILFGGYGFIMGIISSILIWFLTALGMHDGSMS